MTSLALELLLVNRVLNGRQCLGNVGMAKRRHSFQISTGISKQCFGIWETQALNMVILPIQAALGNHQGGVQLTLALDRLRCREPVWVMANWTERQVSTEDGGGWDSTPRHCWWHPMAPGSSFGWGPDADGWCSRLGDSDWFGVGPCWTPVRQVRGSPAWRTGVLSESERPEFQRGYHEPR